MPVDICRSLVRVPLEIDHCKYPGCFSLFYGINEPIWATAICGYSRWIRQYTGARESVLGCGWRGLTGTISGLRFTVVEKSKPDIFFKAPFGVLVCVEY